MLQSSAAQEGTHCPGDGVIEGRFNSPLLARLVLLPDLICTHQSALGVIVPDCHTKFRLCWPVPVKETSLTHSANQADV